MKKFNIKLFAGLLFLLLANYACSEKDLETKPTLENALSFYEKEENLEAAIWMMYDGLRVYNANRWGNSQIIWGGYPSEDVYSGGSDRTDQTSMQDANFYTSSPNDPNGNLSNMWQTNFQGIYNCNTVLEYTDETKDFHISARAEAKFLKGLYYFYLVRMFGGLPLIKSLPLPNDQFKRATAEETYQYIEELLTEAVNAKLSNGVTPAMQVRVAKKDPENGRATLASAQALLGKVLVYRKKYKEAIVILEQVASNPNYELEKNFYKLFKGTTKHNIESLFEVNYTKKSGPRDEAMGNAEMQLMGPRTRETSKFNDTISPGWGFNQPTTELINAFIANGDMVRLHATAISTDSLKALDKIHKGAAYVERTWENNPSGWWSKKHYPDPTNQGSAWGNIGNNNIILRLADVYLLLAEAYNRDGNDTKALEYLNKVRARVKLAALNVTGNALFEAIKTERRLELALEGERYFDLLRWGDADAVLGPLGYAEGTPGTKTKGLYPIPLAEINRTSGQFILEQNEGY